jgi:hypothetical protein
MPATITANGLRSLALARGAADAGAVGAGAVQIDRV